ncbi:hypothetical protein BVC80_8733g12 [Macleaya cordata]|uniref:Zinc finger protein n=1 Tax=Macleaya cordata TaxID=56857 RepID=A0A200QBY8_MACCD|nr:hypothetical protein BVC80_8733g12 [Macleaya cordata]
MIKLTSRMLIHESISLPSPLRLESQQAVLAAQPVANIVAKDRSSPSSWSSNGTRNQQGYNDINNRGFSNNNRGHRNHVASNCTSSPPICHLCGHGNHVASNCWQRFDQNYVLLMYRLQRHLLQVLILRIVWTQSTPTIGFLTVETKDVEKMVYSSTSDLVQPK